MLTRSGAIASLQALLEDSIAIAPLGNTARELYSRMDSPDNFYFLGSMGMPIPFALGVALAHPELRVVALEGDGGALMNLGALATAAVNKPPNLKIVILDNEMYESTGGQPSHSQGFVEFAGVARMSGFVHTLKVANTSDASGLQEWLSADGLRLAVVKVSATEEKLPRVAMAAPDIFERFSSTLNNGQRLGPV